MSIIDPPAIPVQFAPRRRFGFLSGAAGRTAWAMADQAVVSLGNYATVILVTRNLADAKQFGMFAMLMETLLFLNSLQQAVVIYPLLVRGAVLDNHATQRLATGCLALTLILCVPLGLSISCASLFVAGTSLLLWAPLALIFQQLQETVRRAMLAHLRFAEAIPGDAISYVGQALILLGLGHRLTLPLAFMVMAVTSLAAVTVQALQLGLRRFPLSEMKELAADFWSLSKWVLYSNLGSVVTGLSYFWVLYRGWGSEPVGLFAAVANVVKLVNPLTTALSGIIIPSVSRAKKGGGTRFAMRVGLRYATIGMGALLIYFGVLALFPEFCLRMLYSHKHPEYLRPELANYMRILLCSWTLLFITSMMLAILNGLGYSRANFFATLANAIVSVLVALPMVYWLGLKGSFFGGLVATGSATIVAIYCFIRHHDGASDEPSAMAAPVPG